MRSAAPRRLKVRSPAKSCLRHALCMLCANHGRRAGSPDAKFPSTHKKCARTGLGNWIGRQLSQSPGRAPEWHKKRIPATTRVIACATHCTLAKVSAPALFVTRNVAKKLPSDRSAWETQDIEPVQPMRNKRTAQVQRASRKEP